MTTPAPAGIRPRSSGFFDKIGRFAVKYRYLVLAFWLAVLIPTLILAPKMSEVAVSDQSGYLPADSPSRIAQRLAAKYFPDQIPPSQAVLVLRGRRNLLKATQTADYLRNLTAWLETKAAPRLVTQVLAPTDPAVAKNLASADGRTVIYMVSLKGAPEGKPVRDALARMQDHLDRAPSGITGYVTGSTAIAQDYKNNAMSSASRTTLITVALVIAVLLVVFRSPILPIVPLGTIAISFFIARGVLSWMASLGWMVSSITEVFLVVLLFGAGTDYCLFLVSRYREFMADGLPSPKAAASSVARVGETITSSAGTVIVGMVSMYFARMSLFATTGPSLAIGVMITLLAGLTLTPALLSILGRVAFWPGRPSHAHADGFWVRLARFVGKRPWIPLGLTLCLLVPLALYGQGQAKTFDLLADLPNKVPSKAGYLLLAGSMGQGDIQPLEMVLTRIPGGAHSPQGIAYIDRLTQTLLKESGVADVRSLTRPTGSDAPASEGLLRVSAQLRMAADQLPDLSGAAPSGQPVSPGLAAGGSALGSLVLLRDYLVELAGAFPGIAGSQDYQSARSSLNGLAAVLPSYVHADTQLHLVAESVALAGARLGQTQEAGIDEIKAMFAQINSLSDYLGGLTDQYPAIGKLAQSQGARQAVVHLNQTVAELQANLLVTSELNLLARALTAQAESLTSTAALAEAAKAGDLRALLRTPGDYLKELRAAYPVLDGDATLRAAAGNLEDLTTLGGAFLQELLVAHQLQEIALDLAEPPQAVASGAAVPGPLNSLNLLVPLGNYLAELGDAYPVVAQAQDYQTALTMLKQLGGVSDITDPSGRISATAEIQGDLTTLREAIAALAGMAAVKLPGAVFYPTSLPAGLAIDPAKLEAFGDSMRVAAGNLSALAGRVEASMPEAVLLPKAALQGATPVAEAVAGIGRDLSNLAAALNTLGDAVTAAMPEATCLPQGSGLPGRGGMDSFMAPLLGKIKESRAALLVLAKSFAGLRDGFYLPSAKLIGKDQADRLLSAYTTRTGDAARLQVVLKSEPFAPAALETVARLQTGPYRQYHISITGGSAVLQDLSDVMGRDFNRVMILVLVGIFLVLVLLLRSLVSPICMLGTILLSYYATLGLVHVFFGDILHKPLTWWVPFFMFTLLVALGMDYNIFLMGRVKEEVAGHRIRPGVERALARSGNIITSAGVIMAGTFAAMLSSSLLGLVQLAFAVAVGVLLDTFIIRTLVLPSIVMLLGRWNWWPGKGPRPSAPESTASLPPAAPET